MICCTDADLYYDAACDVLLMYQNRLEGRKKHGRALQ